MTKIQKLFLGLVAASTVLSASAEATKEGNFYLGAGAGAHFLNKVSRPKATGDYKVKSSGTNFDMSAAVGYYVMENAKAELAFLKPFLTKSKVQDKSSGSYTDYAKVKPNVWTLQARGYYDVFDISDWGKAYVGAGAGIANASGKITLQSGPTYKFKNSYNFAFSLIAGAEFNVADNTNLALEYAYSDNGRVKTKTNSDNYTYKTALRGHSVLAKIKFDI